MRIGLLTRHWVTNFGANLQALATFCFLRSLGHEVVFLNYRPLMKEKATRRNILPDQWSAHENHCKTYFTQSPVLRDGKEIAMHVAHSKFDVIIAGSDSLFRIKKSVKTEEGSFPNPFWLTWLDSQIVAKPRAGFLAVSAEGSFYWFLPKRIKADVRQALMSVDYVSVRDRWSQYMVNWITGGRIAASLCPDPVSVLNDVFVVPSRYAQEATVLHKKYILLSASSRYFSKRWVHEFVGLAHAKGLQVFTLPQPEREFHLDVDRVLRLPMEPLTWYSWIQNAAGVIAERFHSIACCIFNNVPFVGIDISGPMLFRGLAIRQASKAYDICLNIGAGSRSFLPLRMRLSIKADKAMKLLIDWDGKPSVEYQTQAKEDFARTVRELIGE